MRLLCVPHCPRHAIIWKQSLSFLRPRSITRLSASICSQGIDPNFTIVHSPPLYLSYVCDACRPCHETPAVLCAIRSPTGQTTDLLSSNDVDSTSSLWSHMVCAELKKITPLACKHSSRHSLLPICNLAFHVVHKLEISRLRWSETM